uniref:Uncharacterized protein n=1 Tax=Leersia perrieri TaxID=77586 RepID=A0A0D9VAC3_9ORYZ
MSAPGPLAWTAVPSWTGAESASRRGKAPPDSALRCLSSAPIGLALTFGSFRPTRPGRERHSPLFSSPLSRRTSDGDGASPLQAVILVDSLGNQGDLEGKSGVDCGGR